MLPNHPGLKDSEQDGCWDSRKHASQKKHPKYGKELESEMAKKFCDKKPLKCMQQPWWSRQPLTVTSDQGDPLTHQQAELSDKYTGLPPMQLSILQYNLNKPKRGRLRLIYQTHKREQCTRCVADNKEKRNFMPAKSIRVIERIEVASLNPFPSCRQWVSKNNFSYCSAKNILQVLYILYCVPSSPYDRNCNKPLPDTKEWKREEAHH